MQITTEPENAKLKFIFQLQDYIAKEKGDLLFDQLYMDLADHELLIQNICEGSHKSIEACVNLDLDLLHMVYTN